MATETENTMLRLECLKMVRYNPINQNTGKANNTEAQMQVKIGPFKGTNCSNLK